MFWIHKGGWQTGDKSDVALPKVLGWLHRNIARYRGGRTRIFVGGHSERLESVLKAAEIPAESKMGGARRRFTIRPMMKPY
jgi:carboxylesterase type B